MSEEKLAIPKSQSWEMFNQISSRYDFLNRILSLGLDVGWRQKLVRLLPQREGLRIVDLATGTADVAITLAQDAPQVIRVDGIDMAQQMLAIGRVKVAEKQLNDKVILTHADAQELPFDDGSFDVATISFGIRNVPVLTKGLMEMYRVINNQGKILILEFSMPANPIIRLGHVVYLRFIVPILGYLFSGNYKAYKYLNQTIEQFPYGERFCHILNQVGFTDVKMHPLLFGTATIYEASKV